MIKWAFNFRAWQPTRSEWMFCGQCIQSEEKDRIQRFVFKKDAKAAMVGLIKKMNTTMIKKKITQELFHKFYYLLKF